MRYDSGRGLIVITLDGGCEFAFPVAVTEGLADAPRSKLAKIERGCMITDVPAERVDSEYQLYLVKFRKWTEDYTLPPHP